MRTDEEILSRIQAVLEDDVFGYQVSDLRSCLPFEVVKDHLPAGTIDRWTPQPRDREGVLSSMRQYMPFAVEKATHHRGLSADRSLSHYSAWVWLLGDADYDAIDWEAYEKYGAPVLKQLCDRFEFPWPADNPILAAMANGDVCPDCVYGDQTGCKG